MKKFLSIILCVAMLCSLLPNGVLAEDNSVNIPSQNQQIDSANQQKITDISKQLEQIKSQLLSEQQALSGEMNTTDLSNATAEPSPTPLPDPVASPTPSENADTQHSDSASMQPDTVEDNAVASTSGTDAEELLSEAMATPASATDFNFDTSTGTITRYVGTGGNVEIPSQINGVTVTSIGSYAFYSWSSLTNITIPNSVTSIGDSAFDYCGNLTSITIPSSVTSIGSRAFDSCSSLTSITIPSSVTNIRDSVFSCCSKLTSITIPDSVTSIGNSVFQECSSLANVTIPSSVTSIGNSAFQSCSSLANITIPSSVTSIGNWAFSHCNSLTNITISSGVTSIGDNAFYNCNRVTSITIPNSVTSIGNSAFMECSSLTSITISSSVTNIGNSVFQDCRSLTSITIPSSVISIGNSAFYSCSNLTSIAIPSSVTSIRNSAFQECSNLTSITIPNSVTSIGNYAFYNCSGLTSITIPNSVTSIENYAFCNCSNLTSITMPSSVTSIGGYAFSDCSKLTSITIPDSVTSIGECVFNRCYDLTNIIIPNSITSISNGTFSYCNNLTSVTIPNGLTSIGNSAFKGCYNLTSIIIPNNVTRIGEDAFNGCMNLASITIPNGVTCIENGAFNGCSKFTSITIPDSVTSIGDHAFSGCINLPNITIPNGVTSIGGSAFKFCDNLTSITIPNSVTSIGSDALCNCSKLTEITIPNSVTSIGSGAFANCFSLTSIIIPNSVTSIRSDTFYYCNSLTSITIPDSVTSIGSYAFSDCSNLTSITIPNDVTSIGSYAFNYCNNLTNINIPDKVTSIENYAFRGCGRITNITIPNSVTSIGEDAFEGCGSLTSITIPNGVTGIGKYAFYGCSKLTSITIPGSVTSMGRLTFYGCTSLTSVIIQNGVTYIANDAFGCCSSLISITIPDSVISIGNEAFSMCSKLASITIPNSVTSIGDGTFFDCSSLISIIIPNSVTRIGDYAFGGCSSLTSITVPEGVTKIENRAFYGCSNLTSITIPNSVTSIGNSAFYNCSKLTTITIPRNVTSIGEDAFSGCSSLTSITIPDGVTSIGDGAFSGCSSLTSITIPDGVTSIGDSAFSGCSSLTSITIPDSVTSIGYGAFYMCSKLTSISIPSSVTNIGGYAFCDCSSLTSIAIPNGVTSIREYAFYNCSSLTSITIPDNITSIGYNAFYNCSRLTSITIPDNVTSIGERAFINCSSLTSITIPSSVTSIGYGVFSGCSSLTSVTIPSKVTSIGEYAFDNCSNVTSITIPDSVTIIRNGAFYNCSSLTSITIPNEVLNIGEYTFGGCSKLTSITIPESVTSIGNYAFYNCSKLTIITLLGCYAERYAKSHSIPISYISFDNATIQITIPATGNSNQYSNMLLTAVDKNDDTKISVNTTESLQYSFGGLTIGDTYKVTLTNKFDDIIGEIDNITAARGINNVSFSTLKQTTLVNVSIKDNLGNNVTNETMVKWYDKDNNYISQGNSISEMTVGTKLFYTIVLDTTLGTQYVIPTKQSYTVVDRDNSIQFALTPISTIQLSGKVTDSTTGDTLQGTVVSISQLLNGKYPKNIITTTDSNGIFTAQVFNDITNITVSKNNYVSKTMTNVQTNFTGNSYDIGEIKLPPVSGARITLNMTYTYSALSGNTPIEDSAYYNSSNVRFTLFNQIQNKQISSFSVQYPYIVLLESTNSGDIINITATSVSGDFKALQTSAKIQDNLTATAQLDFVQNGSFKATYTTSANTDNVAIVYDSNGKYVKAYDFINKTATSDVLADGNYNVVFIGKSLFLNNIQNFSDLSAVGLVENTDYTKQQVQITNGAITTINNVTIPLLNESKQYYTDNSNTSFAVNKSKAIAGAYFILRNQYTFKDTYKSQVSNIKVVYAFPSNCQLMPNSIVLGNFVSSNYAYSDNILAVPVSSTNDIVRFCAVPTTAGSYSINAFLQFDINGNTIKQPMGAVTIEATALTIDVPDKTAQKTVTITGIAMPNSDVIVYDNNVVVGQTKSLLNGSWSLDFELYKPYTYSTHDIYAEVSRQDGIKAISEIKRLIYDMNYVVPSKVTMVYRGNNLVFDLLHPSTKQNSYSYNPGIRSFTFVAEFLGDNALVSNVYINVWTSSGNVESLPATYDANKKVWIASNDFDSNNLPVNVSIDYNYNGTITTIDKQEVNDEKEEISSLLLAKEDSVYLNETVQDLKNNYNLNYSFDNTSSKLNIHTDGIGEWVTTIGNCDGLDGDQLVNQKFSIVNTTDGDKVYYKQSNDSSTIVDFKSNLYIEYKMNTSLNLQEMNASTLLSSNGNDEEHDQNQVILECIKTVHERADTLNKILKEVNMDLDKASREVLEDALKLSADDPMRGHLVDASKRIKGISSYLKSAKVISALLGIYEAEKNLSDLNDLYCKLPNCPLAKDLVKVLKDDITYTATGITCTVIDNTYAIMDVLYTLIIEVGAAPETGGASLTLSILSIGFIIFEQLANWGISEEYKYAIKSLHERASMIQSICTETLKPSKPKPKPPQTKPTSPVLDPSGYVYEAVASNRVPEATTTIYYKANLEDTEATLWDASEYQQENPLTTDANGAYAWDVPLGWWQVKYEKEGYQTTYSEWLPVPPPQVDVNVGITSFVQPKIDRVNGYADYIEIVFDKYMNLSTLTADNIKIKKNGTDVLGTIEILDAEENPKKPEEKFARKIHFKPSEGKFTLTDNVELTVSSNVKSYADVNMNSDYIGSISISIEPKDITTAETVTLDYGGNSNIEVNISPKESATGKKVKAVSSSPTIATVEAEAIVNNEGNAVIPVTANMTGTAYVTLSLDGTDLQTETKVQVEMPKPPMQKVSKPVSTVPAGSVANNTQIQLSTDTPDAIIYYTTDGTCPCSSATRQPYTGAISITKDVTILAVATKLGMTDSDVSGFVYTLIPQVQKPTANPSGGEVTSGTKVTLSTVTSGAVIYYTTNGTIPTTLSSIYSSAISITSATTINAIAVKDGMQNSYMLTASYTIQTTTGGVDIPTGGGTPDSNIFPPPPIETLTPTPTPTPMPTSTPRPKEEVTVTTEQITQALKNMITSAVLEVKAYIDDNAIKAVALFKEQDLSTIAQSKANALAIDTGIATVTLSKTLINTLKGDVTLSVEKVDVKTLPQSIQTEIGDRPVFNFTLTVGTKTVSNFGNGGTASVSVPYTPKQDEDINAIVIYYVEDNGKVTVIPNCIYDPKTRKVNFKVNHFSKYAIGYHKVNFVDVSGWATEYISYLSARGIINGVGDNKFAPENNITRAEFVKMLAGIAKADVSTYKASKFNDVDVNSWYMPYVAWSSDIGIVNGVGDNKFAPDEKITREEIATIITRLASYLKYTLPSTASEITFADSANISSWAKDAVKAVQLAGIISGKGDNLFDPQAKATRAEAAKMLAVFCKLL